MRILNTPLALIVWLGCAASGQVDTYRAPKFLQSSELNPNTAVDDAQRAGFAQDFRLLAVRRYSLFFPGANLGADDVEKKYGYRVIEGTSDHWRTKAEAESNIRATNYAKAYNAEILKVVAGKY